jgi:soluble P-type ATPase
MAISISIPAWGDLRLENVLFDLNGTLALDGIIAASTRKRLVALADTFSLYVMSADTHSTLERVIEGLPVQAQRVPQEAAQTVAIGNGRNDVAMLEAAALGIAILGPEGAAKETVLAADLIFGQIDEALDCLANPQRLVATLRG